MSRINKWLPNSNSPINVNNDEWIEVLNFILFQWFFIRFKVGTERIVENYTLLSYDIMSDGNISSRGMGDFKIYKKYAIKFWIFPLTGWIENENFLNKNIKQKAIYYKQF